MRCSVAILVCLSVASPCLMLLFKDVLCSFLYIHAVMHRLTVLQCSDVRLPREKLVYMFKLGQ